MSHTQTETGAAIIARIKELAKTTGVRILMTKHQENTILNTGSELPLDSPDTPIPWLDDDFEKLLLLGSNYRPTPTKMSKEDHLCALLQNAMSSYYSTIKRFNSAVREKKIEQGKHIPENKEETWEKERGFGYNYSKAPWHGWNAKTGEDWLELVTHEIEAWQDDTNPRSKMDESALDPTLKIEGGRVGLAKTLEEYVELAKNKVFGPRYKIIDVEGFAGRNGEFIPADSPFISGFTGLKITQKKTILETWTHIEIGDMLKTERAAQPRGLTYKVDNLTDPLRDIYNILRNHPWRLRYEKADKGSSHVLYTESFRLLHMKDHITAIDAPYEPIEDFLNHFEQNKHYQGAGSIRYASSLNTLPPLELENGGKGDWNSEKEILVSIFNQIDDLVGNLKMDHLITANIAARLAAWLHPARSNMAEMDPRARRGIGEPDLGARAQMFIGKMRPLMKVHKDPLTSRLVHGDSLGPFSELQALLRDLLRGLREDFETHIRSITIHDTPSYTKIMETLMKDINKIPETKRKGLIMTHINIDVVAMYPSLNADFLIKEISEICAEYIRRGDTPIIKTQREKTHQLVMKILIFLLEHNLVCADLGKRKRKTFFRSTQGIPTGAKCSGDLANLALLNKEHKIYMSLRNRGIVLELQKRYIDDGTLAWFSTKKRLVSDLAQVKQEYDTGFPSAIRFEWADPIHVPLYVEIEHTYTSPKREYLDLHIWYEIKHENTPQGKKLMIILHHTTFKKACAGDLYIHFESAHKKDEKMNLPLNQRGRFLMNSSHETHFNESWSGFKEILKNRGYPLKELAEIEAKILWSQKQTIILDRTQKKRERQELNQTFQIDKRDKTDWIVIAARPGAEVIAREMKRFRDKGYGIAGIKDFEIPQDIEAHGFLQNNQISKTGTPTLGGLMAIAVPHNPDMDRRV